MTQEIKCLGENLKRFLVFLVFAPDLHALDDLVKMGVLLEEPNIEKIQKMAKELRPTISEYELDKLYKMHFSDYHKSQLALSEFQQLGKNYEEIRNSLRSHVDNCLDCSKKYLHYLSNRLEKFDNFVSSV